MLLHIPVSVGELVDKITILEIKSEKIQDSEKLGHIIDELKILQSYYQEHLADSTEVATFATQLKTINLTLWSIEDDIRVCESRQQFDETFIELARQVYLTNDERCRVKREINRLVGSAIVEEKSYKEY